MSDRLLACTKCNIIKLETEFSRRSRRPKGRLSQCKQCVKEYNQKHTKTDEFRAKQREYRKKRRKEDYENARRRERRKHLKNRYNMTLEEYNELYARQSGLCALCNKVTTSGVRSKAPSGKLRSPVMHVHHCHMTNEVKCLLCSNCNSGLGLFEDNPEIIKSAISYLKKHQQ